MSLKLLFADDSVTMQKVIRLTLESEDVELEIAGTGQEALEKVQAFLPDVVVADISLPEIDGYDLCRRIKSQPETADLPVLLISGEMETYDPDKGDEAGAVGHITKPFKSREFIDVISSYGSFGVVEEDEDDTPPPPLDTGKVLTLTTPRKVEDEADDAEYELETEEAETADIGGVTEEDEELLADNFEEESESLDRISRTVFGEDEKEENAPVTRPREETAAQTQDEMTHPPDLESTTEEPEDLPDPEDILGEPLDDDLPDEEEEEDDEEDRMSRLADMVSDSIDISGAASGETDSKPEGRTSGDELEIPDPEEDYSAVEDGGALGTDPFAGRSADADGGTAEEEPHRRSDLDLDITDTLAEEESTGGLKDFGGLLHQSAGGGAEDEDEEGPTGTDDGEEAPVVDEETRRKMEEFLADEVEKEPESDSEPVAKLGREDLDLDDVWAGDTGEGAEVAEAPSSDAADDIGDTDFDAIWAEAEKDADQPPETGLEDRGAEAETGAPGDGEDDDDSGIDRLWESLREEYGDEPGGDEEESAPGLPQPEERRKLDLDIDDTTADVPVVDEQADADDTGRETVTEPAGEEEPDIEGLLSDDGENTMEVARRRSPEETEPVSGTVPRSDEEELAASIERSVSSFMEGEGRDLFRSAVQSSIDESIREIVEKQVEKTVKEEITRIIEQSFRSAMPELRNVVDRVTEDLTPKISERIGQTIGDLKKKG